MAVNWSHIWWFNHFLESRNTIQVLEVTSTYPNPQNLLHKARQTLVWYITAVTLVWKYRKINSYHICWSIRNTAVAIDDMLWAVNFNTFIGMLAFRFWRVKGFLLEKEGTGLSVFASYKYVPFVLQANTVIPTLLNGFKLTQGSRARQKCMWCLDSVQSIFTSELA